MFALPMQFVESFRGLGKYGTFAPGSEKILIPVGYTSEKVLDWEGSPGKFTPNESWPALTAQKLRALHRFAYYE